MCDRVTQSYSTIVYYGKNPRILSIIKRYFGCFIPHFNYHKKTAYVHKAFHFKDPFKEFTQYHNFKANNMHIKLNTWKISPPIFFRQNFASHSCFRQFFTASSFTLFAFCTLKLLKVYTTYRRTAIYQQPKLRVTPSSNKNPQTPLKL